MKLFKLYAFTITALCASALYGAASTSSSEGHDTRSYDVEPLMVEKFYPFFTYNRPYGNHLGRTYESTGLPGDVPLEMQIYHDFLIVLLKTGEDENHPDRYNTVKNNKYSIIVFDLFFNRSYALRFSIDNATAPSALYNFDGKPTLDYCVPETMLRHDTPIIVKEINTVKKYLDENTESIRRAHINELIGDSELAVATFKKDAKTLKDLAIASAAQLYLNEMKATGKASDPSPFLHSHMHPWQADTILSFLPDIPGKHLSLPTTSPFRLYKDYANNRLFQPIKGTIALQNLEKIAVDPNGNYAIAVTKITPNEDDQFVVKFKRHFDYGVNDHVTQDSDEPKYKFSVVYPRPFKTSSQ